MKKTEWYPSKIKPVRIGVYEIKAPQIEKSYFSYFDGRRWGYRMNTLTEAIALRRYKIDSFGIEKWRGLSEKP